MNLGIGLSLTSFQRVPTVPLEDPDAAIAALFGSGEVGAWYDPSDSTTVFQDAAGTTPAGVGDPVGLILDKSKGLVLGAEEVTNGTFDTDTDWTKGTGWTIAGGVANHAPGSVSNLDQNNVVTGGKWYRFTVDATASGGTWALQLAGGTTTTVGSSLSSGSYSFVAQANATNTILRVFAGALTVLTIDNISVRELPGNHATQTTSAARPVLQQSGGLYYLDFDGVDDSMAVTFAAVQAQPNSIGVGFKFDVYASKQFDFVYDSPGTVGADPRHSLFDSNGTLGTFAGTVLTIGSSDFADHVVTTHYNTTSSTVRLDGSVANTGDIGSLQWGGVVLGGGFNQAGNNALNGRIYSFVGVNRTLTAGEITDLETYLAAKSGVTI